MKRIKLNRDKPWFLYLISFLGGTGSPLLTLTFIGLRGGEFPAWTFGIGVLGCGLLGMLSYLVFKDKDRPKVFFTALCFPFVLEATVKKAQGRVVDSNKRVSIVLDRVYKGLKCSIKHLDGSVDTKDCSNKKQILKIKPGIEQISIDRPGFEALVIKAEDLGSELTEFKLKIDQDSSSGVLQAFGFQATGSVILKDKRDLGKTDP